jgi:hypothetical protein
MKNLLFFFLFCLALLIIEVAVSSGGWLVSSPEHGEWFVPYTLRRVVF